MFACRSKPSRCAWHGPREVTQGASASRPSWSTRAPARGPSARRPWTEALLMPASAGDSIRLNPIGFSGIEPAAPEQALHPRGDPRQHAADLIIGRRRQRPELERPFLALEEDAVEEQ